MKKYVYTWLCTSSMEINHEEFNTFEEAYAKMEEEYNDVVDNLEPTQNDIGKDYAYAVEDYEWVWQIIEVAM